MNDNKQELEPKEQLDLRLIEPAARALKASQERIEQLDTSGLTSEEAQQLGAEYLARQIEYDVLYHKIHPSVAKETSFGGYERSSVDNLYLIISELSKGNYGLLKKTLGRASKRYIMSLQDTFKLLNIDEDPDFIDTLEVNLFKPFDLRNPQNSQDRWTNQQIRQFGEKLGTIADTMEEAGPAYTPPTPAIMDAKFNRGGE